MGSDSVITEYEAAVQTTPRWVKSYVYLGGRLLATIAPNGGSERVEYHHPDRLGTRLVTNNQDTTSFEQVALPFGTAFDAESSGATKRRFTSYDRSTVSGLDYAVNRHYDPLQGRFTQVDPIGMRSTSLGNPQTPNLYAYCANDPINHTDPSGLGFFSFLGKIFGAIGKALHFVAKVLAVVAAVMVVVSIALGLPGGYAIAFAVMSGLLFATAYGPPIVGKLLSAAGVAARRVTVAGTPPINRTGNTGLGAISSFLQRSPIISVDTLRRIVLAQAINAAIAAISRRTSCRELFVGYINPIDVLREIQGGRGRGAFGFGTRDPFGRSMSTDVAAVTTPKFEYRLIATWRLANVGVRGADITINTAGPFFTGYRGRFGASDAVNRAVTVIHELGHAVDYIYRNEYTSSILDDMDNPQVSAANSDLVYNSCFR